MRLWIGLPGLLGVLLALAGCQKAETGPPKKLAPEVKFAVPVVKRVFDYELFTGKTESSTKVDLRARVTGYLDKTQFVEGTVVEKDAPLFLIDQRPYKVELDKGKATLASAQAAAALSQSLEMRGRGLLSQGALSKEDYDKLVSDVKVARANVLVAEAHLEQAKLNLLWTEVKSPFMGRVGRWNIDPGNLIKADDTILTTIVAVEPMFVTFDVDERTVLRQLLKKGSNQVALKVEVGLVDEPALYPHAARINFVDNRLDSATGSLWMRAEFDKPTRLIQPGMFSRVRFPLTEPADALCVSEVAIAQNQGQRSLFVVDENNKVTERKDLVFGRQHGALRVVKSGLEVEDRVVVAGLQRIKNGDTVRPVPLVGGMPGQSESPPDEPKEK